MAAGHWLKLGKGGDGLATSPSSMRNSLVVRLAADSKVNVSFTTAITRVLTSSTFAPLSQRNKSFLTSLLRAPSLSHSSPLSAQCTPCNVEGGTESWHCKDGGRLKTTHDALHTLGCPVGQTGGDGQLPCQTALLQGVLGPHPVVALVGGVEPLLDPPVSVPVVISGSAQATIHFRNLKFTTR